MERKWYDEGFDKNKVEQDIKSGDVWEQYENTTKAKNSLKDRLKKFPMNLVEFLIWIWLLMLCWSYIQSHPAEKSSLFSWIESIIERVDVKVTERRTGQWEELQRKNSIRDELVILQSEAEDLGECVTDVQKNMIDKSIATLESKTVEEFIADESIYNRLINRFYSEIQKSCK